MQTGPNDPQGSTAGRKRRSERYYSPQLPETTPSADGQPIPVPKAIQRAQTGAQQPIMTDSQTRHRRQATASQPAVVRTPAADFNPEKPRRQTGMQPAVIPGQDIVAPAQSVPPMQPPMRQTGVQMPVQPVPPMQQPMRQTGVQMPVQPVPPMQQPMRQTGVQMPVQPVPPMQQPMRQTGVQMPVQPVPPMQQPMRQTGVQMPVQPVPPMQQPMRQTGVQMPVQPAAPVQQPGFGWQQASMQAGQARFGQNLGGQPPMPPVPPTPGMGQRHGNNPDPQRPRRQGGTKWPLILVIALILIGGIAAAAIYIPKAQQQQAMVAAVNAYNARYCDGVYVDGISLGGMTQEEAATAVINQAQQRTGSWSVRLMYQGQLVSEINAGMLGMSIDVEDALRAAWAQGHTGTPEERAQAMDALRTAPYEAWSAQPSSDTSVIDQVLETIRMQVYRVPQNASIATFNPDASNPFTFNEAVQGRMLDVAPIKQQIYHMLSAMESGEIELTPTYVQPEVTVADLQRTVVLRGSAYTEIGTTSTEDRNNNIRRALELANGKILAPGEVFSFNDTVGERSTANGFYHALEYVYDELTDGIGGGVCQASTTLMQAALKAGLTVTDHTPHSEKANYSEYGLDATVYWNGKRRIDMKFKNVTDGNIYIVCSVQSNPNNRKRLIAKVDIYGMDLADTRYELEARMVEELPYEEKTVRDKDRKYVTYTDESEVVTKGRIGYVYDTYRITRVNGVSVSEEFIFQSTYKKRDEVTYIGTVDRPIEW